MPPSHTGGPRISQGEPLSGPRPGTFDFTGGMMPHPMNPMETGLLDNIRPGLIDGRQVDPHLSANAENVPFGQSSSIHSNTLKVNGILGKGAVGGMQERNKLVPEEPLKPYPEDHLKPFPLDSGHHVIDQSELEDLKKFPGPVRVDGENVSKFDRGIVDWVPQGFGDRAPHLPTHGIGPKSDRSVFCQSAVLFQLAVLVVLYQQMLEIDLGPHLFIITRREIQILLGLIQTSLSMFQNLVVVGWIICLLQELLVVKTLAFPQVALEAAWPVLV